MEEKTELVRVNEEDKMLRIRTGRVLHAVRKFHGYGQMELAKEFNVSQANISKIEAGILAPDLHLWMEMTRVFKIKDPYCFFYGSVELEGIPKLAHVDKSFYKSAGFKIPKDYQSDPIITSRKIRPLIQVFELALEKQWDAFLSDTKMPRGIFDILNFPLPSLMVKDLASFFNEHAAKLNLDMALDLRSQANHGDMFQDYASIRTPFNILKHFIHKQREYGVDFEYTIAQENGGESSVGIKVLPAFAGLVSDQPLGQNSFFNFCAHYPLYLMKMKDVKASPRLFWQFEECRDQSQRFDVLPGSPVIRAA